MELKKIKLDYKILWDIARIKLGLAKLPLFISWAITNKCAYKCMYCSNWQNVGKELELFQIYRIIDELSKSGTRRISFTGGEPFLKKDLDKIVNHAIERNILVNINSSGVMVKENSAILKNIKTLVLSLDGPKPIHNLIRDNHGAYDRVIEAALCAKKAGIKLRLSTVINKLNINCIDFLLQKAEELQCSVMFQPASSYMLRSQALNSIALSQKEYFDIIDYLIKRKRQNYRIANSLSGLRFFQQRFSTKRIRCWGGLAFFRIEPDGLFHICPHAKINKDNNYATTDIKKCINDAKLDGICQQCFSAAARIEFNCMFSLKIDSLINFFNIIK